MAKAAARRIQGAPAHPRATRGAAARFPWWMALAALILVAGGAWVLRSQASPAAAPGIETTSGSAAGAPAQPALPPNVKGSPVALVEVEEWGDFQ